MPAKITPLKNIKILDLSRLLPGPFCSHLLQELGAQVTTVEHPTLQEVLSFPEVHRGKKKKFLDLKNGKDRLKFNELVKKNDVILEGFRPGVLDRLGFGFKALRKINPKIILCSLSGYGKKGGEKAGHDLNYLSLSGMISALAAGRTPQIPGVPLADLIAGMNTALRIAAALSVPLLKRKALHLDLSIEEAAQKFLVPLSKDVIKITRPIFSGGMARYHLYRTSDSLWLAVAPLEDKFWKKFVAAMNIPPEILEEGESEMVQWLERKFHEKSQKEWLKILSDPDLCVTPVL